MMYLGQTITVKLPAHVAERYNAEYPGNNPVDAGTLRPGVVVAINDEAETANVILYHDGPQTHYVQNVPLSVLADAGDGPAVHGPSVRSEPTDPASETGDPTRKFDQALVGDGSTFVGPGDERPAKPLPADQSPAPGDVVPGVPANSAWRTPAPQADASEPPTNADLWEADSKE